MRYSIPHHSNQIALSPSPCCVPGTCPPRRRRRKRCAASKRTREKPKIANIHSNDEPLGDLTRHPIKVSPKIHGIPSKGAPRPGTPSCVVVAVLWRFLSLLLSLALSPRHQHNVTHAHSYRAYHCGSLSRTLSHSPVVRRSFCLQLHHITTPQTSPLSVYGGFSTTQIRASDPRHRPSRTNQPTKAA